jgi:hypothetical protein
MMKINSFVIIHLRFVLIKGIENERNILLNVL